MVIKMCLLVVYFNICAHTNKTTKASGILWQQLLYNWNVQMERYLVVSSNRQLLPNQPPYMSLLSFLYVCTQYHLDLLWPTDVKGIFLFYCGCFTQDLVEYYKQHSLKEGFSSLDTTLQVPYRELSNGNMPRAITRAGSGESSQTFAFTCLTGENAISSDQIFIRF